jgi:hypothetical protein
MPNPHTNAAQSRDQTIQALSKATVAIGTQGPSFERIMTLADTWARVYAADVEATKRYT